LKLDKLVVVVVVVVELLEDWRSGSTANDDTVDGK
jgi:hypothetical protein